MRTFPRLLLAVLLALSPVVVSAARAQEYGEDDYIDAGAGDTHALPGDYRSALAPYGNWMEDAPYGDVWQPSVSVGWAPYVNGSWDYTPDGWTWASDEPWAWTFHYGRWVLLPTGWAWVPGSTWGPAWVDWFSGDGFVGWAPLSPFGVTVIENFVIVHEHDFCARRLSGIVVNHHLLPDQVIHDWHRRDPERARPPDVGRIERVSQGGVCRFEGRPPGTVAPPRGFRTPRNDALRVASAAGAPHRLGNPVVFGQPPAAVARLGQPWQPGRASPAVPAPERMVRAREFVARPVAPAFTVRRVPAVGPRRNVGPVPAAFAGQAALSGRFPARGFRAGPGIVGGRGTRLGAAAPSAGSRAGMTAAR